MTNKAKITGLPGQAKKHHFATKKKPWCVWHLYPQFLPGRTPGERLVHCFTYFVSIMIHQWGIWHWNVEFTMNGWQVFDDEFFSLQGKNFIKKTFQFKLIRCYTFYNGTMNIMCTRKSHAYHFRHKHLFFVAHHNTPMNKVWYKFLFLKRHSTLLLG